MIDEALLYEHGFAHEGIFTSMEVQIMEDIVRRIRDAGQITRSADFQIWQLYRMGWSDKEIKKAMQVALNASDTYIDNLYKKALETDYISSKELYTAQGIPQIPFKDNEWLQQLITEMVDQTKTGMHSLSQSLGFMVKVGDQLQPLSVADFYNQTLDNAIVQIQMGAFDYNTVLKQTVKTMTNSGLRWIDYSTGVHNRVPVAARRAVMTGLSQISQQLTEKVADEIGTEYFEVSAHATARPTHAVWQGEVYDRRGLEEECGLGDVGGLLGANCYHSYMPFVPGISQRNYTEGQLEAWRNPEPDIEYGGKMYTPYQASQQMRRMETQMRAQRESITLLKQGGAKKEDIQAIQSKYRITMANYKTLAERAGMKTQLERVYLDGLGSMRGTGKPPTSMQDRQKGARNRYTREDGRKVIDKATYNRLTKTAKKEGVEIIIANTPELIRYLDARQADASTIDTVCIWKPNPTISEVLEELHHFRQNKQHLNDDKDIVERAILNEIDAKEYLISVKAKYNIPEDEDLQTHKQLESYKKELLELRKREDKND